MPSFDDATSRAVDRPAFSNGTEGDAWMEHWCFRCTHDLRDDGCPLVLVAMLGQTPAEWREVDRRSLGNQYRCTLFQPDAGAVIP
jgi:hypothetical protein